jgi:hypothetical protein
MKRLIIQKIVQNKVHHRRCSHPSSSSLLLQRSNLLHLRPSSPFFASSKFQQACCEFKVCECYSPFTDCSSPLKQCSSSSSKLAHVDLSCFFNPARNCLDSICQLLSRSTFQLQMLLLRNLLLLIKFSSCILILELSLSKLSLCNF